MTLFFADLVREFSYGTGDGPLPLSGALPGHRAFADAVPAGAVFHYAVAGVTRPGEWETGEGRIEDELLVRAPQSSSEGGAAVAFGPGLKTVALTATAQWFTNQEEGGGGPIGIADVEGLEAALAEKAEAAHAHEGTYEPADPALSALAAISPQADRLAYFTGPGTAALATLTPFGRSLVDDADAAGARSTLGLGTAATRNTGTSGANVPLCNGAAVSWANGATFGGQITSAGYRDAGALVARFEGSGGSIPSGSLGLGVEIFQSVGVAYLQSFDRSGGAYAPIALRGSSVVMDVAGATVGTFSGSGLTIGGTYRVAGTQVVAARRTGWAPASGAVSRAAFETASVTTAQLAERVKALIDDLSAHGLIGS